MKTNDQPTQLVPFTHAVFGDLRTVTLEDESWFAATDVCRSLGIQNVAQACHVHPENEKATVILNDSGKRPYKVTLVNEPGLYRLIFKSRKSESEAFKDWVFHEVLPSIRKTGSYSIAAEPEVLAPINPLLEIENRIRAFPLRTKRDVGAYEDLLRLHARLTAGEDLAAQSGGSKKVSNIFLTWLRCIGEMQAAAARRSRTYSNQDIIAMGSPVSPTQTSRYLAQLSGQPIAIYAGHVLIIVPTRTNRQRGWEFRIEKTNGIALVK